MNPIEKTRYLIHTGKAAITNPAYLKPLPEQQERSLLGQRLQFLAFHRYLYNLNDQAIYRLWDSYRDDYAQTAKAYPDDAFCDLSLMRDALQFQIAIRDDRQADPGLAEQIAISFHNNARLAKDFPVIDSQHLINLAETWQTAL